LKGVTIECEVSFIKLKSYSGTQSTGVVSELIGFDNDIRGRDIIILEDIVDTGRTLKKIFGGIEKAKAKVCFCC
jgi:hypoxanthine-guanine phosphoribosyltransferase